LGNILGNIVQNSRAGDAVMTRAGVMPRRLRPNASASS
jgi:hypothetical protein